MAKDKCHYCRKLMRGRVRLMGGERYCVECAAHMQKVLTQATEGLRRLKISQPKFFSVRQRKRGSFYSRSAATSPAPSFAGSKPPRRSETAPTSPAGGAAGGDKPSGPKRGRNQATQVFSHLARSSPGFRRVKSPSTPASFAARAQNVLAAAQPKKAKTTTVGKLRRFFEIKRKEAKEALAWLPKPRPRRRVTRTPVRSPTVSGSKVIPSTSANATSTTTAPKAAAGPARGATTKTPSSATKLPSVVEAAMEFTESRAVEAVRSRSGLSSPVASPTASASKSAAPVSVAATGGDAAGDDDMADFKAQMRAWKKTQADAIKSAAKDQKVIKTFEAKYSIQDDIELGSGLTAVVKLCVNNKTRDEYAVKIISKENSGLDAELFRREIAIMARMKHKNVIKLVDYYETSEFIYIVQECAYGGELFDRILEEKQFSEKDASKLTTQILSALAYMHGMGIVHRDMKPENILYESFEDSVLKISDFGFAKDTSNSPDAALTQQLGTQGYCAPEVFSGDSYDSKCDIWSMGVIVYILLCGLPPFVELDEEDLEMSANQPFWLYVNQMNKVQDKPVKFEGKVWDAVSQDAKDFLKKTLQLDPKNRPTAAELLKHSWIAGENQATQNLISTVKDNAISTLDRPKEFVRARFEPHGG